MMYFPLVAHFIGLQHLRRKAMSPATQKVLHVLDQYDHLVDPRLALHEALKAQAVETDSRLEAIEDWIAQLQGNPENGDAAPIAGVPSGPSGTDPEPSGDLQPGQVPQSLQPPIELKTYPPAPTGS